MVHMIMNNIGKGAAHTPLNPGLPAVVNLVITHDMPAYGLFVPTIVDIVADGLGIGLRAAFGRILAPRVIFFICALPQADAAALGIMDFTVFNDPAFTPVWTHRGGLKRGRRRPLCRHFTKCKAGYRDIV